MKAGFVLFVFPVEGFEELFGLGDCDRVFPFEVVLLSIVIASVVLRFCWWWNKVFVRVGFYDVCFFAASTKYSIVI